VEQIDKKRNGKVDPSQIVLGSYKKLWWRCPKGPDHIWNATVRSRVNFPDCPMCANRKLSITNCLSTVAPEIAAQWDKKKNIGLTPRKVRFNELIEVYWKCPKRHSYKRTVNDKVKKPNSRCPLCQATRKRISYWKNVERMSNAE